MDNRHHTRATAENIQQIGNLLAQRFKLIANLIAPHRRQALQAKLQNGAGLRLAEAIGAVIGHAMQRIINQRDKLGDIGSRPSTPHKLTARLLWRRCFANKRNHFINIGDSNRQTDQYMRAVTSFIQLKFRAAGDDFFAEGDKCLQHLPQIH